MVLCDPDVRAERLRELLGEDALLRLYCVAAAETGEHRAVGELSAARNAIPLGELARWEFPGDVLPLKRIVAGRPPVWTAPEHLAEFVVRPLLITFRGLLARGFLPVGELGVELDSAATATGRIVLGGIRRARSAVPDVIAALDKQLDELAAACVLISGDEQARVRAAFDRVIAQELRHLAESTAAAFAGDHPWRRFVHVVATEQHEILSRVIRLVRARNARCRHDPGLPRPLVVVDLDFCALHPKHRVGEALRRLGETHGIDEFADPARLDVLPGLYRPGWRPFLAANGLLARYPELEWDALYAEYRRNVPWHREALSTDDLAPGLVGFVRDLEQAGGRVVWLTGRRHRMRAATEEVLARHGLGHLDLRTTDDGPVTGIAGQKVAALHDMPGHELVAAFDDSAANRDALQAAFPAAVVVAVRPPGFTVDGADRTGCGITTFESLPQPLPLGRGHRAGAPQLSHVTSLSRLRIRELSTRPTIWSHGVELTGQEQSRIVESLAATAVASGRRLGREIGSRADPAAICRALWRVVTAKPFGAVKSAYPPEAAERDMLASIEVGDRIPFVVVGPSLKQDGSRLKALGGLPDLAELAMLIRLRQLDEAVRQIHPPGIAVRALTDASHFRFREPRRYAGYHRELAEQVESAGLRHVVSVEDFDDAADAHPRCGDRTQRPELLAKHRDRYETAFAGLDVRRDPRAALGEADARDPAGPGRPRFAELFRSVLQAVDIPCPGGDPFAWSQRIYADPFELTDPAVPAEIRRARGDLLATAWRETITYLANKHVDEELDYSVLWRENCVRMSLSIRPAPGRLRFVPLGGAGVMPWHGTAALNDLCEVSVDYAISLVDQGFVPVRAARESGQPWFMVPARAVDRAGTLDPAVFERIRLRGK
ncbi:hypothetical protein AB0I53_00335 [Saccharopolyspora sp. NPDC050389]|uniref:hypothetical protein n=1 Tax=Saccharopolyspora sp. NPDC050389 TaxID=3155516 RepID=UPI0033FF728E